MLPHKIKELSLFIVKYFAIGGLIVWGGLVVLLGTQAFQTMTPSTPTATGTTLSVNNSTGTYLAMRWRAPCSSGTAMIYEDKCLDLMTWTAANRTACFAKKWGGWISVNPEHLNAVNAPAYLIWNYYGTASPNARWGMKTWAVAAYSSTAGPYYSSYTNSAASLTIYGNNVVSGNAYPTGVPWMAPIIDYTNTTVDNSWVSFVCAYFRDLGN